MKGGVKFYRGASALAVAYVFSDERTPAAQRDDYYLAEGSGTVTRLVITPDGVACDELDAERYATWVEGFDPLSGGQRGRPRCAPERAVRFVEVTVNGPKTWTIAAELHPDVAAAYEAAQDRAVGVLAERFFERCTTRTGAGGHIQQRLARVEVVAVRHHTTRAGDPHRHVHVQLNARVQGLDGRWRGLDTAAFRAMVGEINGLGHLVMSTDPGFRAALASHGYHLDVAGEIPELASMAPVLSKRHAQIETNTRVIEAAWRADHPGEEPSAGLRRLWDHQAWQHDRPTKATGIAADVLARRWEDELVDAGHDVAAERARPAIAPSPLANLAHLDRDQVALAAVGRVGAQRSLWNDHDVMGAVTVELAETGLVFDPVVVGELVEDCAARALDACHSVAVDPTKAVASHVRHLTSPQVMAVWDELQDRLAAQAAVPGVGAADQLVTATLAALDHDRPGTTILDGNQLAAVRAIAGTAELVNVEGAAGAGKTTMLAVAVAALEADGHQVVLVAPSAKAATVAELETGAQADTLAKLVYEHGWRWDHAARWTRLQPGDTDPHTGVPYRGPTGPWRLEVGATVIVDEAGMVDQDTALALLTVADEAGARVVHVGDRAQLPPVGRGGYLDATTAWSTPVEMTIVHRFTRPDPTGRLVPDDDYAALSLAMRRGDDPDAVFDQLAARGLAQVHPDDTTRRQALAAQWCAAHDAGRPLTITVATNHEAALVAGEVRARRVAVGQVDDTRTANGRDANPIGAGDQITTRRNDTSAGVLNREDWTVQYVHPDGSIDVTGGIHPRTARLDPDYVTAHVTLAYATTDYGTQSATAPAAALAIGDATTAGGLYVGMTRGRLANVAHLVADDLDDARTQWVAAAGRDRSDRGLTIETTAARHEITRAPTPPTPRALADQLATEAQAAKALVVDLHARRQAIAGWVEVEAARLGAIARQLDTLDRLTTTADRLTPKITAAAHRLTQARHDLDVIETASGPWSTYRAALHQARGDRDHTTVDTLRRYRKLSAIDRDHHRGDVHGALIGAQRHLTTLTVEHTAAHTAAEQTRTALDEADIPDWLHDPQRRDHHTIDTTLRAEHLHPIHAELHTATRHHEAVTLAHRILTADAPVHVLVPWDTHKQPVAVTAKDWDAYPDQRRVLDAVRAITTLTPDDITTGGTATTRAALDGRHRDTITVDLPAPVARVDQQLLRAGRDRTPGLERDVPGLDL